MILTELQDFVIDSRRVSLAQLKLHFRMEGDALRQMLSKLVRKGRVRQLPMPDRCDGCTCCDLETIEFYEWIEEHDRGATGWSPAL
ncbi:MAG: FeoC-like transcriptional regulator [Cyanobacteriota bacterium]|nr:FeoC-like transcriptional regulator [Cyanobacteriota bacterium]